MPFLGAAMESLSAAGSPANPCKKCNRNEATLTSRAEAVCQECFVNYISLKCSKQMGILAKEVRSVDGAGSKKFLVGLSLGVSSSVLLDLLHESVLRSATKGRRMAFQVVAVYVDADPLLDPSPEPPRVEEVLSKYRERYPYFTFESAPLVSALGLRTIDWAALPAIEKEKAATDQIQLLFERLPSTTSKADVLRLLVKHILISRAVEHSCTALLLGYSTTALAELTLSETAKGRGFSLPWQVHDGAVPVLSYPAEGEPAVDGTVRGKHVGSVMLYSPLRDLLRKELVTYTTLVTPPLTDIIPENLGKASAVVSHKDLSIEEVMVRYFAEVEHNYPSVVANVAKTTGKLDRIVAEARCGMCNMPLDELGDERWRGEIGDDDGDAGSVWNQPLCYGCKRSIGG